MDPFEDCLAKGRLKKVEPDPAKVEEEIANALQELERSRQRYSSGNWGDAATQGYFAMYRSARAAVYSRGYRDTNLYGLCAALQRIFVDSEELPSGSVDMLRNAKDIKDIVYEGERGSRQEARDVLLSAQQFVKGILTALALPKFDPGTIETTLPEVSSRPPGAH